ncbi:kinase-like domain-containing protein [Abortiporus biennis]|nr:kinase-like domain-containing protein [Abortiporus biennis]
MAESGANQRNIPLPSDATQTPQLNSQEVFWRDIQPWLQEKGYMLRPRYRVGWKPSFTEADDVYDFEDGYPLVNDALMDATRISTDELVMLKRVSQKVHPHEVDLTRYFSEEPIRSDPRNHCIQLVEVLDVPDNPDLKIMVLPLLRKYNSPSFETIGEALEFFRQIFEGLFFMHQCHIAHRDCGRLNIMMDPKPMFPNMYHPRNIHLSRDFRKEAKSYSRTARPPKYYLIDFGLSRQYDPDITSPRELPIVGGDKSVPEFRTGLEPMDPFPTDVYYLGNVIRVDFLQRYHGMEFIKPLVEDMVQDEPSKRPTMEEVNKRFMEIYHNFPKSKLRSRLVGQRESKDPLLVVKRYIHHYVRTLIHILLRRNPLPIPA